MNSRCCSRGPYRCDRGGAEPLFILPIAFAMVVVVAHIGVWSHAQHRVQSIAAQTLSEARSLAGSPTSAQERADQAREQIGGGLVQDVDIEVHRNGDRARVRVQAQAVSLLPDIGPSVSAEVSGPVERGMP